MTFEKLNLIPPILQAIKTKGYNQPTPIQAQAIPPILLRKDLLGCAQTGTGKTAAFAIPTLQILHKERRDAPQNKGIKALIITPTRELAIQIEESFTTYGKGTHLQHTVIFGGVKQYAQVNKLKSGVDILVATPGRLVDLMNQGFINLQNLKIFTLDEADRMLDMGFIHDIKKIIAKLPPKRQSLFFSATMSPIITKLAQTLLSNPTHIEITPVSSTAETITQKMYLVEKENKKLLLTHILKDTSIPSALIFTRTKYGADKITRFINKSGIKAEAIHGNKSQNARQSALKNFKNKQTRILVATDIAARGIDIDELSHVINYEIPNEPESYVHRIGRTGRAGTSGIALSFCDREEQHYVRNIHKLINKSIPVIKEHPYHSPLSIISQEKTSTTTNKEKQTRFSPKPQRRWNRRK